MCTKKLSVTIVLPDVVDRQHNRVLFAVGVTREGIILEHALQGQ
jgi:hypothetical protein